MARLRSLLLDALSEETWREYVSTEEIPGMYGVVRVFTGNANPAFAGAICEHIDVALGRAEVFEFSNENIFVRLLDCVREQDVFVVQPFCSPVSRSILELLIMIDAVKRASAARITAVIPYFAYARTDKKDQPRVPITARLLADMITVAGANRVMTVDLHAGQIQGFFTIPVDELTALHHLSSYFARKGLADAVVVAPDLGSAKKARNFAERLGAPLAIIEKRRLENSRMEMLNIIGEVSQRRAIIVDDEVDTAGSLVQAVKVLEQSGVKEVYACCTHAVLSGPAIDRIRDSSIVELVCTDTLPIPETKRLPKIKVLSLAPLFGDVIRRVHEGGSVGALIESFLELE